MTPAQYHAQLTNDAPILADGLPYGVHAFGGDITTNKFCRETAARLNQFIPYLAKLRIIEIGAGGGRWTRWLDQHAETIFAVDAATRTKDHLAALHLQSLVVPFITPHWTLPTGEGSPLRETFDLAFTYDTYVHANRTEITTSLKALADALRPGGLLVAHYGTLERKLSDQPHDDSGLWITHWPYWFNTQLDQLGFEVLETNFATEGFGSAVVFARKRGE